MEGSTPESHTKEFKFYSEDDGVSTGSVKQNVSWVLVGKIK